MYATLPSKHTYTALQSLYSVAVAAADVAEESNVCLEKINVAKMGEESKVESEN